MRSRSAQCRLNLEIKLCNMFLIVSVYHVEIRLQLSQCLKITLCIGVTLKVEKDAATTLKEKMDEIDEETWHCIIGNDFGKLQED